MRMALDLRKGGYHDFAEIPLFHDQYGLVSKWERPAYLIVRIEGDHCRLMRSDDGFACANDAFVCICGEFIRQQEQD
jgi:hypothetical protein